MSENRIRELRAQRDWSADDLAHRTGLSAQTIYDLENKKHRPQRTTRRLLAQAFGVSEDDIFPREDIPA